ncbi:MAG: hypothetical protein K2X44_02075, partial [Magnetospirillum sp.]|nr:hypothetical protein [Magnetospirillum sp.]
MRRQTAMTHSSSGADRAANVLVVTELMLPRLLWLAFRRQPLHILAIAPFLPPLRPLLERLVGSLIARGRARPVVDLCPELSPIWAFPTRTWFFDVFHQTEEWHDRWYGFPQADARLGRLAFAYKQVTCNHSKHWHFPMLAMKSLLQRGVKVGFHGISGELVGMLEAYEGVWPLDYPRGLTLIRRVVNLGLAAALALWGLVWIARRTRSRVEAKPYFFAADFIGDRRDFPLYSEVRDGGAVLLIPRAGYKPRDYGELADYDVAEAGSGLLTPGAALGAALTVMREAAALWWVAGGREVALFYSLATIPAKRAVQRAFFTRYAVRHFWNRDDYNVEHILRRDEIHRIGGVTMGITHGSPTVAIVQPMWRYITCDYYYVFGPYNYERYMKPTWDCGRITPVGTFGVAREDYPRQLAAKPKDILIFTALAIGNPRLVSFIRTVAEAFPDRKVLLQYKAIPFYKDDGPAMVRACQEGLDNVVPVTGDPYELLQRAHYVLSDPSTIIIEAIQFGGVGFCIDVIEMQKACMYRAFPDLNLTSGEEAVSRIRAIESGEWRFPRETFAPLI